jgi:hypothetical protein
MSLCNIGPERFFGLVLLCYSTSRHLQDIGAIFGKDNLAIRSDAQYSSSLAAIAPADLAAACGS